MRRLHSWTSVAPLLAAIFAPFSVLFDIPALTENWFIQYNPDALHDSKNAIGVPDPIGSIVLSAVGLGFNVCANALLLVRFSTSAHWWRIATRMSVLFWILKTIIALVNISVFGGLPPGMQRGEGFWCAMVSLILCGLIMILLLAHWISQFDLSKRDNRLTNAQMAVRVAGRHFMLNVTFFVIELGIFALLAAQVEHWTYFQGIYFTTVTYLTIGFGELRPSHTVTRALLFFFALIGIAQIGNIVGILVEFFNSRSAAKRAVSRMEHESRMQEKRNPPGMKPDLAKEMEYLHRLVEKEEARTRAIQLVKSLVGLVLFWVVGAATFSALEGWSFGTGMYFAYISFLTIGYGDYVPSTPPARVVFVVYAIIAVPIMASFAVRAVQQVLSAFSARQYHRTKAKRGLELDVEQYHRRGSNLIRVTPHAEFVENWHRDWEEQVQRHEVERFSEGDTREMSESESYRREEEAKEEVQEREFNEEALLTEKVLELALSLEWRARKLLTMHMDAGGNQRGVTRTAKILLRADHNVQLQEVKGLLREITDERGDGDGQRFIVDPDGRRPAVTGARTTSMTQQILQDDFPTTESVAHTDGHETLKEVRRYREDFAGLLAAGSRLMKLQGRERALFERRSLSREIRNEER